MIKFGCMALTAMVCATAIPAAHAQGNFFVAGQFGQTTYDDSGLDDDSASSRALSAGFRWQAGPIVQIGVEAGFGSVDEVSQGYYDNWAPGYVDSGRIGIEADYRHLGANARINFGEGSRWFAIARGGYMAYEFEARGRFQSSYNGSVYDAYELSASDDGGGAYFGAGVGVDVTPSFNVNLMFNGYAYSDFSEDYYSVDEVGTATSTTLGLELRF